MLFRRSDLHQLLYCQYPMVGDIAALVETPILLADAPFSIEPVFVEIIQVLVIGKFPGFLDHVSAIFLRGMDVGDEIKPIQMFCQIADCRNISRFRCQHDCVQLLYVRVLQRLDITSELEHRKSGYVERKRRPYQGNVVRIA